MQKCLQFLSQGKKCLPTNYRPISVLPVTSKLIEKHISRHIYQYLAKYNLLHDAQSDFRSNNSCQTALINIIDKWINLIVPHFFRCWNFLNKHILSQIGLISASIWLYLPITDVNIISLVLYIWSFINGM